MSPKLPWNDRAGRFAPLKAAVFALLLAPGLSIAADFATGALGPRPVEAALKLLGLWAIRLLFLSLAVTPLRQAWRWLGLVAVRRMVGVAAFAYAALHFLGFVADKKFDLGVVATEIVLRYYLAIGAVTLAMLLALAATSTDRMLRRMGGRAWQRLHRLAYAAGLLAALHFFMQSKINAGEPMVMAGLLLWLMAWRVRRPVSAIALAGLAVGAAGVTVLGEALYFRLFTGVDPWRVLAANIDFAGRRPGWIVLLAGLGVAAVAGGLSAWRGRSKLARPLLELPR